MAKKDYSVLPKKTKKEKSDTERRVCRLVRLMLMLDRGVLNLERAAEECGVNKRTIQRDLKILEGAGISLCKPVETNSNYVLDPEFRFSKLHITPENLENFRTTTNAMLAFSSQPLDLLNPIQKEVFEMSQNDEHRRRKIQENAEKDIKVHTTAAQFNSMLFQGETSLTDPLFRLQMLFLTDDIFGEIGDDRNFGYKHLQLAELARIAAHGARITRKYNEAIETLKWRLEKDPKDAWAWGELAFVYYEKGEVASAIQTLKTGYKKTLDDTLTLYLAFLLGETKHYEIAIKYFKSIYSQPDIVLSFSAEMHKRAGKLDLALQEIEQALSITPDNAIYQMQRGIILKSLNSVNKK